MTVTQRQIDLIRSSFDTVRRDVEPQGEYFYAALFRRAPRLRSMFRDDITGQGMKFMGTLAVIVDNLHDPGSLAEKYAELGRLHAAIGVKAEHFEPLGEALIDTMRNALGDAFTPETEAAWRAAYAELSDALVRKGGISGGRGDGAD